AIGQVTQKRTGCGGEKLLTDGTVKKGGGVCDGGDSLLIGDSLGISTGGGGWGSMHTKYITDIKTIGAGDRIQVRYAKDERGNASTNCSSCYIKKLWDYGKDATF